MAESDTYELVLLVSFFTGICIVVVIFINHMFEKYKLYKQNVAKEKKKEKRLKSNQRRNLYVSQLHTSHNRMYTKKKHVRFKPDFDMEEDAYITDTVEESIDNQLYNRDVMIDMNQFGDGVYFIEEEKYMDDELPSLYIEEDTEHSYSSISISKSKSKSKGKKKKSKKKLISKNSRLKMVNSQSSHSMSREKSPSFKIRRKKLKKMRKTNKKGRSYVNNNQQKRKKRKKKKKEKENENHIRSCSQPPPKQKTKRNNTRDDGYLTDIDDNKEFQKRKRKKSDQSNSNYDSDINFHQFVFHFVFIYL